MKKQKQLSLLPKTPRFFGGQLLLGKRKGLRPLSSREALHVVIRSSRAMGLNSFLAPRNRKFIQELLAHTSQKYQVKIYRQAIVGNHCHFIIKFPNRRNYISFIRVFTGKLASHVMKHQSYKTFIRSQSGGDGVQTSKKAIDHSTGNGQKFFNFRPFTRILAWARDFKTCCDYLLQNQLEALGCIPYQPRSKHRYVQLLRSRNHE